MKIICSRKDLYEGAGTVARAVNSRSALPILSHILISASDGRIELAATDLELGMRCSVDAKVDEEGAVTAPAKLLTDVLAALPDFDVTIETDDKNTLTLTCGASEFTILGLAADEYPVLPKMGDDVKFKIARKVLSEAVDRTVFATGRDESRPVLSGVYFKLENGTLKLVSTDTHRLCLETIPNVEYTGNTDAIVPAKALREMARLASLGSDEEGVAEITIADGRIMFEVDGITLTSRLIDGVFPNFMRVIPSNNPIKVIAPTDLLRRCAKRCGSGEERASVHLHPEAPFQLGLPPDKPFGEGLQERRVPRKRTERRDRRGRGLAHKGLGLLPRVRRVAVEKVVFILEREPQVEGEPGERGDVHLASAASEAAHRGGGDEEVCRLVRVDERDVLCGRYVLDLPLHHAEPRGPKRGGDLAWPAGRH